MSRPRLHMGKFAPRSAIRLADRGLPQLHPDRRLPAMLAHRVRSLKRQASMQSQASDTDHKRLREGAQPGTTPSAQRSQSTQSSPTAWEATSLSSAAWWVKLMHDATALRFDKLRRQGLLRPLALASGCGGMGARSLVAGRWVSLLALMACARSGVRQPSGS